MLVRSFCCSQFCPLNRVVHITPYAIIWVIFDAFAVLYKANQIYIFDFEYIYIQFMDKHFTLHTRIHSLAGVKDGERERERARTKARKQVQWKMVGWLQ